MTRSCQKETGTDSIYWSVEDSVCVCGVGEKWWMFKGRKKERKERKKESRRKRSSGEGDFKNEKIKKNQRRRKALERISLPLQDFGRFQSKVYPLSLLSLSERLPRANCDAGSKKRRTTWAISFLLIRHLTLAIETTTCCRVEPKSAQVTFPIWNRVQSGIPIAFRSTTIVASRAPLALLRPCLYFLWRSWCSYRHTRSFSPRLVRYLPSFFCHCLLSPSHSFYSICAAPLHRFSVLCVHYTYVHI